MSFDLEEEFTRVEDEVDAQTTLISQIATALEGKAAGGGEIPDGWACGYTEVNITADNVAVDFTFTDCSVDIDDCLFWVWSDARAGSVVSKRIQVGYTNFAELNTPVVYLNNVTSTGANQATGVVPGTDVNLAKSGGTLTATVNYVNTRKFIIGKTYKAIIIGRKEA